MPVIAVTGSLCSGKSTVLKMLRSQGAKVLSLDRLVHRYYRDKNSTVYREVKISFPDVFDRRGNIVRSRLGKEVFKSRRRLADLEKIVHPVVIGDLKKWAEANRGKNGVFAAEVPLLFEKKLESLFDAVVLVTAPVEVLLHRITKKLGLSPQEARGRLALFLSDDDKKNKSDFVINNSGTMEELRREVVELWERLRKG